VFDDEVCALIFFTNNFLILLLRVSIDWLVNACAAVTGKGLQNKRLPTICIRTHFTRRVLLVSTENNVGVTIVELPIVLLGPMGHLRRYIYTRTV